MSIGKSSGDTIADIKDMVAKYQSIKQSETEANEPIESKIAEDTGAQEEFNSNSQDISEAQMYLNWLRRQKIKSVVTTIFSIIGIISGLIGTIFFFSGNRSITYICAAITLLDSFIQVPIGEQKNFATELVTVIIRLIVGLITNIGIADGISISLCIGCLALAILGWSLQLIAYLKNK